MCLLALCAPAQTSTPASGTTVGTDLTSDAQSTKAESVKIEAEKIEAGKIEAGKIESQKIAKLEQDVADAKSSGDNAWMLASAALVLMMTGPRVGIVLWRSGPKEKCSGHHDAKLRDDGHRDARS